MAASRMGELFGKRAEELGLQPVHVHERLIKRGIDRSYQLVWYWLRGERTPQGADLLGLLDVLEMYGPERREIMALALGVPIEALPGGEAA